uniref:UBA domain-containing protein n=1 Tax=Glossina palpalis gambiensis TaxID=67801 RepID=A0A1B0BQ53_9MUSC
MVESNVSVSADIASTPVMANSIIDATASSNVITTQSFIATTYHSNERINTAVKVMMYMGFSNEEACLTQLFEKAQGNIPEALDLISREMLIKLLKICIYIKLLMRYCIPRYL